MVLITLTCANKVFFFFRYAIEVITIKMIDFQPLQFLELFNINLFIYTIKSYFAINLNKVYSEQKYDLFLLSKRVKIISQVKKTPV